MSIPTLSRVQRLDSISLDKTYFTEEGYFVDHPIVTSVGIFEYTNPDGSTRRELRLPEDVFAAKSLASYKGKPIIVTHDAGYVDKDNVEEETIGTILSEGYQDGDDVRAEIIIHDSDAMKSCGLRELSLGYNLRLEETSGEWNGQPYDAIQRDIVINHLALVGSARAGEQARLNIDARDKQITLKGGKLMTKKVNRKDSDMMSPEELTAAVEAFKQRREERMTPDEEAAPETPAAIDGGIEEVAEEAAAPAADEGEQDNVQMVKDRRDRRDAEGDPEDLDRAMGVIAQQDEDIDTLLGVIDVLQAANTDSDEPENEDSDEEENTDEGEDEPAANADRADSSDFRELLRVVRIGDKLNMDGLETMSVKNAKKEVLKKLKPAMRMDGKSAAYVNAAFDMAVSEMKSRKDTNYQRGQMMHKDSKSTKSVGSANDARQRMIDKMKKEDK